MATRTGTKPKKRNIRLHNDVVTALNQQLVHDKRLLDLRGLKPSQYVDAAITLARGVLVEEPIRAADEFRDDHPSDEDARGALVEGLIRAADEFRDDHLGDEDGWGSANHYSISKENYAWLDEMMDELLLANTNGLHGHMINVIILSFLKQLKIERSTEN
ncbi:hypothetical protein ACH4VR_36340 [Streptomyces sp. NPDC020883]|uniref:hypothetical protein n=1 Tax=Streptomyces sp. NPDC020883 TaxID=3365099 RepID=UPI00379C3E62